MRLSTHLSRAAALAGLSATAAALLPAQTRARGGSDSPRDTGSRSSTADRRITIYRGNAPRAARAYTLGNDGFSFSFGDDVSDDRPMLGVGTSSGSMRDTLGVLVTSVVPGGPADKAGITEGDRLVSINGVSLRLAREDAGESDMAGLTTRRLTRELAKVKAGDAVQLQVYGDGRIRTVSAKPVRGADMPGRDVLRSVSFDDRRKAAEDRAVLGMQLQPSGNRRDTLGVLVTQVAEDGPAEKAGVVEGDRIVSVNGVDLRVSREDAGDRWVAQAKSSRFSREMAHVKKGDRVELRVWSAGQLKTVNVVAARAADVYKDQGGGYMFGDGVGMELFAPMAPLPAMRAMPAMPAMPPRPPNGAWRFRTGGDLDVTVNGDAIRRLSEDAVRAALDASRAAQVRVRVSSPRWSDMDASAADMDDDAPATSDAPSPAAAPTPPAASADETDRDVAALRAQLERTQQALGRARAATLAGSARSASWQPGAGVESDGRVSVHATGDAATLRLPGLTLAPVGSDLADYLGAGSERGLLVLDATAPWRAVRAGDVVLAVNGEPTRRGAESDVSLAVTGGNTLDILRAGKRLTVRDGDLR